MFLLSSAGGAVPTELTAVTVGRTTVSWSPGRGLSVAADGVPVIRQSTLYLVEKGWKGTYLDQRDADWKISGWKNADNGAKSATAMAENDKGSFAYTFMLAKAAGGEALTVELRYRLKPGVKPGEFEYGAAYLSGNVMKGAILRPTDDPNAPVREISVAPPVVGRSQFANRLLSPFQGLELKTRVGGVRVEFEGVAPLPVLFDARSEAQDWASAFPAFWLGVGSPSAPITAEEGERRATFVFTLTPPENAATAIPGDAPPLSRSSFMADAYLPKPPAKPLIIPNPKRLTVPANAAPFRLSAATRIVTPPSGGAVRAATILQGAIRERFGLTIPVVQKISPKAASEILIGFPLSGLLPPSKPEGYAVRVADGAAAIVGKDDAGLLWGAQTVVQLLAADETGPLIQAATIEDWPTLAMRGVHLFHGVNALPFHEKLLDRVFSRFKMNALFIEADHLKWDTVGSAAPKWGGTKADIKKEIAYARERGITVYPLVQGYGHMEMLFGETKNRAFAEDPENPWAVNFTDPKAVAFLTELLTEADDLFAAPAFHVGMDEIDLRGRFPYKSLPKTKPELFSLAAAHWRDVFAKRGKPIYLWADMLMEPSEVRPSWGTQKSGSEAKRTRELTPKDVTLVDWQYGTHERFPSLRFLKNAGFKNVLAATWFQPENIQNLSRAAADAGAKGAIQTTWCGYESKEEVLDTAERRQFTAMVLAAEYFWAGGAGPTPDKLPYDPNEIFTRAFRNPDPSESRPRAGYAVRLESAKNRPAADWLGYGSDNAPADFPNDVRLTDGVFYHTGDPILLAGKLNPSGIYPLTLDIPHLGDGDETEIRLALTATHRAAPETRLGTITVTHNDGTKQETALLYGRNIAAWDDPTSATHAPTLWRGVTKNGQLFLLRGLSLRAAPGKTIASVRITSENGESAPCLFAATYLLPVGQQH